jgi:hypothetical protein
MRSRPWPVAAAAILLALLGGLADLPFLWWYLFPGGKDPGALFVYSGILLGSLVFVFVVHVAVQLWRLRPWSFWAGLGLAVLHLLGCVLGVTEVTTGELRDTYLVLTIMAALVVGLIVLPASRRALRGQRP